MFVVTKMSKCQLPHSRHLWMAGDDEILPLQERIEADKALTRKAPQGFYRVRNLTRTRPKVGQFMASFGRITRDNLCPDRQFSVISRQLDKGAPFQATTLGLSGPKETLSFRASEGKRPVRRLKARLKEVDPR
jgi:hypothetical protein